MTVKITRSISLTSGDDDCSFEWNSECKELNVFYCTELIAAIPERVLPDLLEILKAIDDLS